VSIETAIWTVAAFARTLDFLLVKDPRSGERGYVLSNIWSLTSNWSFLLFNGVEIRK
jgi:hypothetical protein